MCTSLPTSTNHHVDWPPNATLPRWLPRLEPVKVSKGLALHESGRQMDYACFPTLAVVALVYETADGASTDACNVRQ